MGAGKADYFVFKTAGITAGGELHRVGLRLYERGRAAVRVLECVAGGRLEEVLSAPLSDLFNRVASETAYEFEKHHRHHELMGVMEVGPVGINWFEISIDRVDFESSPPAQLEFEFAGKFEVMGSTNITRDNPFGDDMEDVQGDATVSGRFTFVLSWEPSDPVGQFDFDQVWLENWRADVSVPLASYRQLADLFKADHTESGENGW